MLLEGQEGTRVELNLRGYQFPAMQAQGPDFDHDANWLRVEGRVFDGDQSWSFDDPCLMTTEAAWLARWLRAVARGVVESNAQMFKVGRGFIEPNVSAKMGAQTDQTVTIVWYFSQESSPVGAADEVRYGEGQPVKTTISRRSLTAAVEDWEAQLGRFPVRGSSPRGWWDR